MGANKSRSAAPFIGRGTTLGGACDDLTQQLRRHIGPHAQIRLSLPIAKPALSPRATSPRYAGPYVAMAILGDGRDHNVTLRRDQKSGEYLAVLNL